MPKGTQLGNGRDRTPNLGCQFMKHSTALSRFCLAGFSRDRSLRTQSARSYLDLSAANLARGRLPRFKS